MLYPNQQQENYNSWIILQLTQRLNEHMQGYGYQVIDLPIIESADLFLIRAGDQIVNKLFIFERNGQQLALRPEFTAAAAHHYLSKQREQQPIERWQFNGYIFEDDPNNSQRDHQRFSIGAELFGISDVLADSEIISMAASGLDLLGAHNWQLILGHVGLLRQLLATFQLDLRSERFLLNYLPYLKMPDFGKRFVMERMDNLLLRANDNHLSEEVLSFAELNMQNMLDVMFDTRFQEKIAGGRSRSDITRRFLEKRKRFVARDQIVAAIDLLEKLGNIPPEPRAAFAELGVLISPEDTVSHQLLSKWIQLMDLLYAHEIPEDRILIQTVLARSWDYYSGVIFELHSMEGIHVGGGGRYDGFARLIGGTQDVPSVGFAYYMDKIITSLEDKITRNRASFTMTFESESTLVAATRWSVALRKHSIDVQLIPMSVGSLSNAGLRVNSDSSLTFGNWTFNHDQLDTLITMLKQ